MKKTPSRPSLQGAVALLFAACLTACQGLPARTAPDLRDLQGHWQGHGPGGDCSVTISGNSLRFHARDDFWYETTFTLPAGTDPRQLHATILADSSPRQADIGRVVVAVFKLEDGKLTLGVIDDFDEPPATAVRGDWDRAIDRYYLERVPAARSRAP